MSSQRDVEVLLRHWVRDGLITTEQAEGMRSDLPPAQPVLARRAASATPRVVEAVGYLGGVLVLVALGLVAGRYWIELSTTGQLAVTGAATVLLLLAGAAAPRRRGGAGARMAAVLWLAAAVGLAAFLGLAGAEAFDWREEAVATFAAGGAVLLASGLWFLHRHPVLHLTVLAGTVAVVTAATTLLPDSVLLPGVAAWGVGVAWALLTWGGLLPSRRLGVGLGSAVTTFAALTVASESGGSVLAVVTVAALVAVAVLMRDLVLLAVATLGALTILPIVVVEFFPGVLAAAIVLLAVGVLLVGAAVAISRRRRTGGR